MTKRKSTKRNDVAVLPARMPTALLADVRELILIVSALRRQLVWTHFKKLIYLHYPLKCVIGQVRNSSMILVDASV